MTTHLHLDPLGGASGDMFLGLLHDLGVPAALFESLPARLGLPGVVVRCTSERRGGLRAGRIAVTVPDRAADAGRTLAEMRAVLGRAALPPRAARRADAALLALFEAEARVHDRPPETIHLHEAGGDDALVDIAGTMLALEELGVGSASCSVPIPLGGGTVHAAHGELPVPAPAVAELLAGIDVRGGPGLKELVTPTGAALLRAIVDTFGPAPGIALRASGHGAGARDDPGRANVLRGLLGESAGTAAEREVAVLECAVDDMLPQDLPPLVESLLAAGARDAFFTPVQMKKGRPGFRVTAIADPALEGALVRRLLAESSTLGVRLARQRRVELGRESVSVPTPWGPVEVKRALDRDGRELRRRAEFESCREAAERAGVPIDTVRRHAERPGGGTDETAGDEPGSGTRG